MGRGKEIHVYDVYIGAMIGVVKGWGGGTRGAIYISSVKRAVVVAAAAARIPWQRRACGCGGGGGYYG